MKKITLKNLEKVNGRFYFPWFPGYSEENMERTGQIKVDKHIFAPNSYYSIRHKKFVSWWKAQLITGYYSADF